MCNHTEGKEGFESPSDQEVENAVLEKQEDSTMEVVQVINKTKQYTGRLKDKKNYSRPTHRASLSSESIESLTKLPRTETPIQHHKPVGPDCQLVTKVTRILHDIFHNKLVRR